MAPWLLGGSLVASVFVDSNVFVLELFCEYHNFSFDFVGNPIFSLKPNIEINVFFQKVCNVYFPIVAYLLQWL